MTPAQHAAIDATLTRERDEARAEVAALNAPHDCKGKFSGDCGQCLVCRLTQAESDARTLAAEVRAVREAGNFWQWSIDVLQSRTNTDTTDALNRWSKP